MEDSWGYEGKGVAGRPTFESIRPNKGLSRPKLRTVPPCHVSPLWAQVHSPGERPICRLKRMLHEAPGLQTTHFLPVASLVRLHGLLPYSSRLCVQIL